MGDEHFFRLHLVDELNELIEIGVIAKRKDFIRRVAIFGIGIDRPASEHQFPDAPDFGDSMTSGEVLRNQQHPLPQIFPLVNVIVFKLDAMLLIHLHDGCQ